MEPSKTLLFIGNSLIEYGNWQEFFPEYKVYSFGVAGETVEGVLARLPRITEEAPHADFVFLMSGLNNIAIDDWNFLTTYESILDRLSHTYPDAEIFVHSLLPTMLLEWIPLDTLREANKRLHELAIKKRVKFIDLFSHFLDREGKPIESYFLPDGVHLTPEGYTAWVNVIRGYLR